MWGWGEARKPGKQASLGSEGWGKVKAEDRDQGVGPCDHGLTQRRALRGQVT